MQGDSLKIRITLVALTMCLYLSLSSSKAAVLFVNINTGNDQWNGTSATYSSNNNGPLKSIQKAIDLSSPNDEIIVAAGVYREELLIEHQLTIRGSGSDSDSSLNTIIMSKNQGTATGFNIIYKQGFPTGKSLIRSIRFCDFDIGLVLARDVIYYDVVSTNNNYGFSNGANLMLRDIEMKQCSISHNSIAGIYFSHKCNVIAFIIDSCYFADNFGGIYAFADSQTPSNIIDFLLKNSVFKRQLRKGVYVEKLDNCIFENLVFDSCGIDTSYSYNAGIDINLKYGTYTNITIAGTEFIHCGIGGSGNFGCGMIVKARDDGSIYGANPAILRNVKLNGLKFNYCNIGLIIGEPHKNNDGPYDLRLHESRSVFNHRANIVSNIQTDIEAHNCSWLSTHGPSNFDTIKNGSGDILVYTWLKHTDDKDSATGFQSDSLVWFGNADTSLQRAIDVVPYNWTLFVPDNFYEGSYFVGSRLFLFPEKTVHLSALNVKNMGELYLIKNDLYISDSLIMHTGSFFNTGKNLQLELSDSCKISEAAGHPVHGQIRTFRNLVGNPAVTDFGGLGIKLTAVVTAPFPDNNVVLIRTTGEIAGFSQKQILRTFRILTHRFCGWNADIEFFYNDYEKEHLYDLSDIQLMRSYDNGKKWILGGGISDTALNMIGLSGADVIQGLWTIYDSVGTAYPARILIAADVKNISCNGAGDGSIHTEIFGGFPPYKYMWSTGDTVKILNSLTAAAYIIEVIDSSNCASIDTFTIEEPDSLSYTASIKGVICFEGNNGESEILVNGGTPPYSILWQDGEKSLIINNKTAGYYSFALTDSNNCSLEDSVFIYQPDSFNSGLQWYHISCHGLTDGAAATKVVGGTSPYLVFWSTGEGDTAVRKLSKGRYYVVVFDSLMCMITDTFDIEEPEPLQLELIAKDLDCHGDHSGEIAVLAGGGWTPYKILWQDGDSSFNRTGLYAARFIAVLIDSALCSIRDSVDLKQPEEIIISFAVENDTNNRCAGSITATVAGGIPPYSLLWDDSLQQQNPVISGLCKGIYRLQITDSTYCTKLDSVVVLNITDVSKETSMQGKIVVYPNPFDNQLFIFTDMLPSELHILDVSGRILMHRLLKTEESCMDVSDLKEGVYFLRIKNNQGFKLWKLVK